MTDETDKAFEKAINKLFIRKKKMVWIHDIPHRGGGGNPLMFELSCFRAGVEFGKDQEREWQKKVEELRKEILDKKIWGGNEK